MGSLSQPRLNIFTVGNMRVMICLGQGGLRSLSASSLFLLFVDANSIEEFMASKYGDYSYGDYTYVDHDEIQSILERVNSSTEGLWNANKAIALVSPLHDAMLK